MTAAQTVFDQRVSAKELELAAALEERDRHEREARRLFSQLEEARQAAERERSAAQVRFDDDCRTGRLSRWAETPRRMPSARHPSSATPI